MTEHFQLRGGYNPLERKDDNTVPSGVEFKKLTDELMNTVAAFRTKNDESIAELKAKKIDDVVLKEHVDRINKAIDGVQEKMQAEILDMKRQAIFAKNGGEAKAPELVEYEAKFGEYIRKGGDKTRAALEIAEQKAIEAKALATTSEPDGGFTVVPQIEQSMIDLVLLYSPVRQFAEVVTIGSGSLKQPVNKRGTSAAWVGETDARPQTATSQLAELEWVPGELYAEPAATQQMLDDSFLNVEQWMSNEVALAFAVKEAAAFVTGDGVKKPKGVLAYNVVADASYSWGSVGYIPTGASGAFTTQTQTAGTGGDIFFDAIAALKYPYRANARFAANRRTVAAMRKIKSTYADYLWVPGLQNGQADSFAGYPLTEWEDMPDLAANSFSLLFGDFKQFYRIVDRMGVRVLRDPFSSKPFVLFYTTKRVGGGIRNFEAAKIIKASVS